MITTAFKTLQIQRKWRIIASIIWSVMNLIVIFATPKWHIDNVIALILGNVILMTAILYLFFIAHASKKINTLALTTVHTYYLRSLLILGLAVLIVPYFFMIHVPHDAHDWDFFVVFANTSALHGRTFDHLALTENQRLYFLHYPNNQWFGMIQNFLFAKTTLASKMFLMTGLSSLLTSSSVVAGSLLAKKVASEKMGLCYNLAAFGFLPFYVYGAQFYTDTASLPFVIFGVLFIIYALKATQTTSKILWWIIALLVIFSGYYIKPTVTIPLIAAVVFLILNKKWRTVLFVLALSVLLFFGTSKVVHHTISSDPAFSTTANERYNLPLIHWVAMSFAQENFSGGFDPNILSYSEQFYDKASKQEADLDLLKENIAQEGVLGVLSKLARKTIYTWLNGDLRDFYYTYLHINPIVNRYFDWVSNNEKGNITGYLLITGAQLLYWLCLLFLMWYEIFQSIFKKRGSIWFIFALSIVGLALFLLFWEANSRYLYNFTPLMILLAVKGKLDFSQRKEKIRRKNVSIK